MLTDAAIKLAGGFSNTAMSSYWPTIVSALRAEGIDQPNVLAAVAATVKAEVGGTMRPIEELSPSGADRYTYFESKYGASTSVGKSLGNVQLGDGYRFRGRGFIQLTGRSNYTQYGRRIGVDLVNNPDLALQPAFAARVLAAYFKDRGVAAAANRGDWERVRRLVNGGMNGWDRFIAVINGLRGSLSGAVSAVAPVASTGVLVLAIAAAAYFFLRRG